MKLLVVLSLAALVAADPTTYFQEAFDGGKHVTKLGLCG